FCFGGSIILNAGSGFASYLWSTSATTQNITVNQSGSYSVQITDINGCTNSDLINITVNPLPAINLGNDTSFCAGGSITLDAGNGFPFYLWSTGVTTQMITVNQSGSFSVSVTDNNGCSNSDQINVTVNPLPTVSLGNDTSFCSGGSITINAGNGFNFYLWNTGATTQNININQSGIFSVQVTDNNGCTNTDQINITVNQSPVINLGNDTSFCQGTPVTFDAGSGFANYLWQDGSTNQSFNASTAGVYYVSVTDNNSCNGADTVAILNVYPSPVVNLGNDTLICDIVLHPYILNAGNGYISYLWQDNSSSQNFSVTNFGTYDVVVTDQNGCSGTDSVSIGEQCESVFTMPNVFTPDVDSHNDTFKPKSSELKSFNMKIYNRWGQKLFESNDADNGWDGNYNGHKCPAGTYFFVVEYSGIFNGALSSQVLNGSLTLIRKD
ncbi:MAG: gliding motility-associated C-terminal domain-containing protein, partial [Bacteroidota bacterium]